MTFTKFPLHDRLQRAIADAGFQAPTPIQHAALPVALAGHDLVGTAQTGSGKTAAFVLPILERLLAAPTSERGTRALILTPTRELAEQTQSVVRQLGCRTNLRAATVYGGVGMMAQDRALRNGTEIIIACPGRLLDHMARGNTDFRRVECLVLDEADRMLDMGFMPAVTRILEVLPATRQSMLFSATFAPTLNKFVDQHLKTPQRLDIGIAAPATTISHALYPVPGHLKTLLLIALLRTLQAKSVLIFSRTKHRADRVGEHLMQKGFNVGVLHSNKSQNQRQQVLDDFRSGKVPYLVATDLAARGLDIAAISHVINFDIPATADDYIHRIGRTGRAERTGEALTLVTLDDARIIRDIERTLGEEIDTRYLESFDYKQPGPKQADPLTRRGPKPAAPARHVATGKKPTPAHAAGTGRPAAGAPRHAGTATPPRAPKPEGRHDMAGRPAPAPSGRPAGRAGTPRYAAPVTAEGRPQPGRPSSGHAKPPHKRRPTTAKRQG